MILPRPIRSWPDSRGGLAPRSNLAVRVVWAVRLVVITAGQKGDAPQAEALLADLLLRLSG